MKKNQKYLVAILSIIFLFAGGHFASALEVTYPQIPFLPVLDNYSTLPTYVSYFFGLGTYIVGVLAVISLAIGGLQLIMSAQNPDNISNAKDRIKGALLGLALTVSAFIILNTINPSLVSPVLTSSGELAGVFYTNGNETKSAPQAEADTNNIPQGFDTIIYKCAGGNAYSPALLIWQFPLKDFGGIYRARTERITCGGSMPIGGGSFKMTFETPGVYFCTGECRDDMCDGYMSDVIVSDRSQIQDPFKSNVVSVRIVNDTTHGVYYGFVLHKNDDPARGGECTIFSYTTSKSNYCKNITNVSANSANIFLVNKDYASSGDGIILYSEPYGWNNDAQAGYFKVTKDDIGAGLSLDATKNNFQYNGISRTDAYQNSCKTLNKCPGSIKIQGNYLVGIFKKLTNEASANASKWYCQIFDKDIPDLGKTEFIATTSANHNMETVDIIPIK